MKEIDIAKVTLWGETVGAVIWLPERQVGLFEYDQQFLKSGLDISPVHMSLEQARAGDGVFEFPTLNRETFHGLPGLLADALPDKFGNYIIDAWLARQGRDSSNFSPVERLCYTNTRGMGALEFFDGILDDYNNPVPIEISELTKLAQEVVKERSKLSTMFDKTSKKSVESILDILRVGTSAGGARPKAVIAMNHENHILSGQTTVPSEYDYWLLKFDGVTDLELGESRGYGRIEYAYHLMACDAGIGMMDCQLLEENGRAHFMTRRFDRVDGEKRHMQSLCGLAHYDFNMPTAYSYEQAFTIMRKLQLSKAEMTQQYRRMLFNVMARNLDDHTKNISFLMDADGVWTLSPAYDVTYAHNPKGQWTNQHQMSINGKHDHFDKSDLLTVAESHRINKPLEIMQEVSSAVADWPAFAKRAGVGKQVTEEIRRHLHYQW